ncbi:MAG: hypothetical protein NTZ04_07255 [Chloroflexi bacterium]|nr:hypothetical protein [Chloroflexota bacterium]
MMASGDSEGVVAFSIAFKDLAGNVGTAVTATTDASSVTFVPTFTITTSAGAHGSITPPDPAVDYNSDQAFDITPDAGYHVASVLVDTVPQGAITSYTFHNVIATHSISATFSLITYQVDVSSSPMLGGSVSPGSGPYVGSTQFTANHNPGYQFVAWTINGVMGNTTNPLTLDIESSTTLVANFSLLVGEAPNQPSNVSPPDGATVVSLSPTLQSSAFSDPDAGDTHAASQWQITTTSDNYDTPVLGMTSNTALISFTVPSSILAYDTMYYWHVRYQDNNGNWSSYSDETSFRTYSLSQPNTPAGLNVTVVLDGVTITFANVSAAGDTTVTQEGSPCGSLPAGLVGLIPIGPSLHITTTATYAGPVRVAIRYDESGILTEGDLRLLHCNGTNWKDVTTSVNTVNNIIYGQDSVLSWWQLGDPQDAGGGGSGGGVPVFPNIYVGIGAALGAFILAYFISRRLVSARE